jgi:hypothetical protein
VVKNTENSFHNIGPHTIKKFWDILVRNFAVRLALPQWRSQLMFSQNKTFGAFAVFVKLVNFFSRNILFIFCSLK